jgi:tetratricopeptide (TPR) repeat protein
VRLFATTTENRTVALWQLRLIACDGRDIFVQPVNIWARLYLSRFIKEYCLVSEVNWNRRLQVDIALAPSAMFAKDLDRAKSEADIALSLNPNFSGAYASLGSIHTYSGRPLEAIEALERATRLDPAFRPGHLHFLGMSYLLAGKYETAAALLRERILLVPGTDFSRVLLASALGHLGQVDEAHRIWKELKEINPKYSFSEHFGRQPFKRDEDVQRIAEGLTKAGLSN